MKKIRVFLNNCFSLLLFCYSLRNPCVISCQKQTSWLNEYCFKSRSAMSRIIIDLAVLVSLSCEPQPMHTPHY